MAEKPLDSGEKKKMEEKKCEICGRKIYPYQVRLVCCSCGSCFHRSFPIFSCSVCGGILERI